MYHNQEDSCYDERGTQIDEIEMISSRHPDSELIKVFVHASEKEELKKAVEEENTNMSHLARALLLEWLEQRKAN